MFFFQKRARLCPLSSVCCSARLQAKTLRKGFTLTIPANKSFPESVILVHFIISVHLLLFYARRRGVEGGGVCYRHK